MYKRILLCALSNLMVTALLMGQQVADVSYEPSIEHPAYAVNKGPLILIDEAHHNFHTISGRYSAFAKVLTRDGYRVAPHSTTFTKSSLKGAKVLVIANAVNERNTEEWSLPTPSAYTPSEIEAVKEFVAGGGSLFLIADHMPFPGASAELAKVFGFTFYNGFATDTTTGLFAGAKKELDLFKKDNHSLNDVPEFKGAKNSIDQVATFTGQAFEVPPQATSLLVFDARYKILLPDTAWTFSSRTKRKTIQGFSQGAVSTYGNGHLAIFGEAAMFTAQLKGESRTPFGLNAPDAKQNLPFLLNIIHWLDKAK